MEKLNNHSTRAHATFSASSAARWLMCGPSALLAERYPNVSTPFTEEGTRAHEVAELIASGRAKSEEVPLENGITAEMVRHAEEYRDYISGLCSPGTTVMLEQRVDFSEWVIDGFGTADCILLTDDRMDVIDYKYGQGVAVSAEHNPQMMLYGLGAVYEYGFVYDVKKVRLHIFQPRLDSISVYECTTEDLLNFGKTAAAAVGAALSGKAGLYAGEHCKFCPHAGHCTELARSCLMKISTSDTVAPTPTDLSPESLAWILKSEAMITAWLKKVKETALSDLLAGKDIPGYKVVEGKAGNRAWPDAVRVLDRLKEAGIPEETYTTVALKSPAELEKALGKKAFADTMKDLVTRSAGAPTVVPEADKRRSIRAADDFEKLEE